MQDTYKKAPNVITCKDLDYLKDIFGWHYIAYKKGKNIQKKINDKSILEMLEEATNLFYENMNLVIKIVKDGNNGE